MRPFRPLRLHRPSRLLRAGFALAGLLGAGSALRAAEDGNAELAKKLANPIANLVSVPFKVSWDTGLGPNDTSQTTYLFQPVVPFSLSADWNLITRTIVPYVTVGSPMPGVASESGLGDITQSFFFSPKALTAGGWLWGAGPVGYYGVSDNALLASKKSGGGATAVLLKQEKGWTYGLLANHIWSLAGPADSADYSNTFLQPFVSFTTRTYTTLGANTESTYDWKQRQWTVPLNLTVAQLLKIGKQPVSFTAGYRKYLTAPDGGPTWGLTFQVTLLFPK